MLDHKPDIKPAPKNGPQKWTCRCGWTTEAPDFDSAEKLYIDHIPENERRQCLLVDTYGKETADEIIVLILPIGERTLLKSHYESDGLRYGIIDTGETLPIYEVRLNDGRIFKAE